MPNRTVMAWRPGSTGCAPAVLGANDGIVSSTAGDLAARSRWPDTAGRWLSQGKSGLRGRPGQSGTTTRVVMPFTRDPSITPMIPRPLLVTATRTTGLRLPDGADRHGLERVQHVDGEAFSSKITNECPAPTAGALAAAAQSACHR